MKNRKTLTLIILVIIFCAAALFFFVKSQRLSDEVARKTAEVEERQEFVDFTKMLSAQDSLLLRGEYQEAIRFYQSEMTDADEQQKTALAIRIEIARELMRKNESVDATEAELANQLQAKTDQLTAVEDSLTAQSEAQGQKIDSLSFALEKAQMRQADLEQQVKTRPEREYLTFTSSKGNDVHYIGGVESGKANGEGVGLWSTGSRYRGEWKNNERHGEGTFHWPDGERYEGEFKSDKRHGKGSYFWSNGESFVGLWKNDKRNGKGTFYNADGKVVASGMWEDDELVEMQEQ
ncbi:MORN repeat-containing protein [Halocola ammonii]